MPVLTLAEAAEDLRVSEGRLWKFHREGCLAFLYTAPGKVAVSPRRRGGKDARIDAREWERFKASLSVVFLPPPESDAETKPTRQAVPRGNAPLESKWLGDTSSSSPTPKGRTCRTTNCRSK